MQKATKRLYYNYQQFRRLANVSEVEISVSRGFVTDAQTDVFVSRGDRVEYLAFIRKVAASVQGHLDAAASVTATLQWVGS